MSDPLLSGVFNARWVRDRLGAYGRFLVSANEAFRNLLSAHDAIRAGEAAIDDCREAPARCERQVGGRPVGGSVRCEIA